MALDQQKLNEIKRIRLFTWVKSKSGNLKRIEEVKLFAQDRGLFDEATKRAEKLNGIAVTKV